MAFVSLLFGTLSVLFSFIFNWWGWYFTALICALGIASGIYGRIRTRFIHVSSAGIILSAIGAVLTVLLVIAYNSIADFFGGILL